VIEEIISALSSSDEGLSYYAVWKALSNEFGLDVEKGTVYYHLEKLRKNGLLEKEKARYVMKGPVAAYDGIVLFSNPPAVVNCPYRDGCEEEGCLSKECDFYEEADEDFKRYLDRVL